MSHCSPCFDCKLFFRTGNHWSGHKLISLNVHQSTRRPKRSVICMAPFTGGEEQLRNGSGSETRASWLVDEISGNHLFIFRVCVCVCVLWCFQHKSSEQHNEVQENSSLVAHRVSSSLYLVLYRALWSKAGLGRVQSNNETIIKTCFS